MADPKNPVKVGMYYMCMAIEEMVKDEEEAVPKYNKLIDVIDKAGELTEDIRDIINGDIIDQEMRHRKKLNQIARLVGCTRRE